MDCSKNDNYGCQGGNPDNAFDYIKDNGIETEDQYPYLGVDDTCKKSTPSDDYKNLGYNMVENSNSGLLNALQKQPVSVGIVADKIQLYESGIFNTWDCGENIDHAVLVTGYGSMNGQKFWRVKNSWGVDFGENGYIRFERKDTGVGICKITEAATVPTLE